MAAALGLLVVSLVPALSGVAAGDEKLSDLKARMDQVQAELNASTQKLEDLHTEEEEIELRVTRLEQRQKILQKRKSLMMDDVIEAATILYKNGNTAMFEALFGAESFAELSNGIELLTKVSEEDNASFIRFARLQQELTAINDDLSVDRKALAETRTLVESEAAVLQSKFDAVAGEYESLKKKLAAAEAIAAPTSTSTATPSQPTFHGDLACPVSGPVSFVDSWGAPRSGGRSHEGVDIMANFGQPVVAIVSGTITYAGYGDTAGNWISLSGDDGNVYWYMHNQQNLKTSGHVEIGEQIAEVGDTGNATGTPHVHFEYHPGGGGPVNPYPIAAEACF